MKLGAVWASCSLIAATVCACDLDRNGLLDDAAAVDDGSVPEGAAGDVWVSVNGADAPDDVPAEVQADADASTEAGPVTKKDAEGNDGSRDATAENTGDGGADDGLADAPARDAPADVRAQDAPADSSSPDAPADAHEDAAVGEGGIEDAPVDGGGPDAVADAPPDSNGPLPIWNGGAIVDPQFFDSDWVSFCVALVTCGEMPSISACVALLHQPSSPDALIPPPDLVNSVNAAAPSCPKIAKLLGNGSACPSSTADTCSTNSLVTCRMGFKMTVDCGSLGMVCSNGNGNAGCGFGDCIAPQEGQTFCVGGSYVAQCSAGRYAPKLDCQTWGAACIGPAGASQCQGTGGTTCSGGVSCIGSSIVECLGGLLGSADCAALYDPTFTCVAANVSAPVCAGGTACDPATYVDTCQPMGQLNFCNVGTAATYDCTANWNGCAAGHCTR